MEANSGLQCYIEEEKSLLPVRCGDTPTPNAGLTGERVPRRVFLLVTSTSHAEWFAKAFSHAVCALKWLLSLNRHHDRQRGRNTLV